MIGQLLPDGTILAPYRPTSAEGDIGDARRRIRPGDRGYEQALADLERDLELERQADQTD